MIFKRNSSGQDTFGSFTSEFGDHEDALVCKVILRHRDKKDELGRTSEIMCHLGQKLCRQVKGRTWVSEPESMFPGLVCPVQSHLLNVGQ